MAGSLVLNFDGACEPVNPGGVAAWGFLVRRDGKVIHEASGLASEPGPDSTNNIGEYRALLEGLRWLEANGHRDDEIFIRGDSKLIIEQAKGAWRVKAPRLKAPNDAVKSLLKIFPKAKLEWVPREQNTEADVLSKKGYFDAVREHPEWARRAPQPTTGPDVPATSKQLIYLRNLGVAVPPGLTLRDASRLIDEAKRAKESR